MILRGDGYKLPFRDNSFDCIIASEILEHLHEDDVALGEIARVLKPGGQLAISVPTYGPEAICWALSTQYRSSAGGHVRIYRKNTLRRKLIEHGFRIEGTDHAHALHSPYWWIKCAVGVDNDEQALVRIYHRFLVWDMFKRPPVIRALERALDPLIGKSLVFYATKPVGEPRAAAA
jgi:SAM-dependent methyltransferase